MNRHFTAAVTRTRSVVQHVASTAVAAPCTSTSTHGVTGAPHVSQSHGYHEPLVPTPQRCWAARNARFDTTQLDQATTTASRSSSHVAVDGRHVSTSGKPIANGIVYRPCQ